MSILIANISKLYIAHSKELYFHSNTCYPCENIPWYYHGITVVIPWYRGNTMVIPQYYHSMVFLLWFYRGITMVSPRYHHGMGIFTMVLPWYGILVPWSYCDIPQYTLVYWGIYSQYTMVLSAVYHHMAILILWLYSFVERDLYHGNTMICISCAMVKHGKWCQVYHGMQLLYFNWGIDKSCSCENKLTLLLIFLVQVLNKFIKAFRAE